jgi:glycosyltransferase involved in cell wall biosynthesis
MQFGQDPSLAISVVICTQNRADLLDGVMKSLCAQTLSGNRFEIIVVDNDSKDHTRKIAEDYCHQHKNVRYCFESQHGLSHARNRGWCEAKGLYVAYVDDDCKMPAQWLTVAHEIIEHVAPTAFGGPYYPFYNSPKPCWWKDCYGAFEQSQEARSLNPREYLRGGNMFFRRSVLENMSGFDVALGMSGHKMGYGEETLLQRRIREDMPNELIFYDPKLYVYHLVRSEKMLLRWALKSWFVNGRSSYRVYCDDNPQAAKQSQFKLLIQAVFTIKRFLGDLLVGILRRDRKRYPYLQNYFYENTINYVATLGLIYEKYSQKNNHKLAMN